MAFAALSVFSWQKNQLWKYSDYNPETTDTAEYNRKPTAS